MRALAAAALFILIGCGADTHSVGPSPFADVAVLVGAGDIADCRSRGAELTAALLDTIGGTVFTAGDNAYPHGTREDFLNCYEPTWGRHKARTRPTPGNHEYETAAAAPYFEYFGPAAGPAGRGYYGYAVGTWTILSLNSNVPINAASPQGAWLRSELSARGSRCTAIVVHHPPFSSGPNGDNFFMRDTWRLLYDSNVDVVIAGHDHLYERFAPQDGDGRPDPARGLRLFLAGTGGASLSPAARTRPNSELRLSMFGVLKLTLRQDGYAWEFIATEGGVRDAGAGSCH